MSGVQAVTLAEEVHHHVADHCPQNSEFFFSGSQFSFLISSLVKFFFQKPGSPKYLSGTSQYIPLSETFQH